MDHKSVPETYDILLKDEKLNPSFERIYIRMYNSEFKIYPWKVT